MYFEVVDSNTINLFIQITASTFILFVFSYGLSSFTQNKYLVFLTLFDFLIKLGFTYLKPLFNNDCLLFTSLLLFRSLNALIIQTSYVPDEFWQSIEVAHNWVFGYGALTWEWYPDVALRSPVHPLIISLIYRALAFFEIDSQGLIVLAPRLFHAFLAALTDLHIYYLAYQLSGRETAKWTLFHQLCNWFTLYSAPRTLSNCLEWTLTTIGLSYFPWYLFEANLKPYQPNISFTTSIKIFIMMAVICVVVRPTSALIWFPMCILHIYKTYRNTMISAPGNKGTFLSKFYACFVSCIIKLYSPVIISCLLMSIILDYWIFGDWNLNQWNFIRFNIFLGGSQKYGTQPWHWYLSQGLLVILWTQTSFVIYLFMIMLFDLKWIKETSILNKRNKLKPVRIIKYFNLPYSIAILSGLFLWIILCYSFLSHKEFRFIFLVTPLAMYFCGLISYHLLNYNWWGLNLIKSKRKLSIYIISFTLITQIPLAFYMCLIHQRGGLDALNAINQRIKENSQFNEVLCLMPCHTVPSTGQLACDPDLSNYRGTSNMHVDEADLFYDNPVLWLQLNYFGKTHYTTIFTLQKPRYILMFDHLNSTYPELSYLLTNSWDYKLCNRFFYAHFLTHRRHGKYILLYCSKDSIK